jgi:hypothetical protein
MNILLSAIITIVGLVAAIMAYPYLYLAFNAIREIGRMNKTCLATGRLLPALFAARDGHANVYLMKSTNG